MSTLLQIEVDDLLKQMPPTVRSSLETLERAGTDWDAVGNLLAATPTAGVALTGTDQWTADLWQAVKWEFRSFACTDSEQYATLRREWDALKQQSSAHAFTSLATLISAKLGVDRGVLAPLVTWLFVVARRVGAEGMCLTLSTAPGIGSVLPRTSYA
jgi:hypothetical protein